MFNSQNSDSSSQSNGYPKMSTNPQYGDNIYPYTAQQSPMKQPLVQINFQPNTQISFPHPQYPQNTPPKSSPIQQPQMSNPPYAQSQLYQTNQLTVQSIQFLPQQQPPQQVLQQNYSQIPQRSQKQQSPLSMESQKLSLSYNNFQQYGQPYTRSQSSTFGVSGLRQAYTNRTYVPFQPVMTTVIQRPIEFVNLEKFEELWQKRITELEDRIRQQPKTQDFELRASNDEDKDALIKQLQDELYKARCDQEEKDKIISDMKIEFQFNIQTLNTQIKQLNNDLRQELETVKQQKQFYKAQCDDKDQHIQNLEREIEELRQHIQTLTDEVTTSQSIKTYEEEAKIWRTKFKELNDTYHACQEKLILTEAELDLLKRSSSQQQIVTTSTKVIKNNVQTNGTKSDSDQLSSSLTQKDFERFQNQSKYIPQI